MEYEYLGKPIEKLEYEEFCDFLAQFGSQKKADFDRKIIRTDLKLIGITSKTTNDIIKYLRKTDYSKILTYPKNKYYEITAFQGRLIAEDRRLDFVSRRTLMEEWIPFAENWAHCDSVMTRFFIGGEEEKALTFAEALTRENREFTVRCGIILLMSGFLKDGYIDRALRILGEIECGRYYYVDMAIAWLCATALIRYKERTLNFLNTCKKIDDFTYAKSLQKARESYRIPDEDKILYKGLISERLKSR